jgi:hypothetical protein
VKPSRSNLRYSEAFLSPIPSRFNHPIGTGKAGRCGFLFYAGSIILIFVIGAGCTGTLFKPLQS